MLLWLSTLHLNSCFIPQSSHCMPQSHKRCTIPWLRLKINWCWAWPPENKSAKHLNMFCLHIPIMKMLQKILPNGVHYAHLFLQYNNSHKFFINPASDLALNAIVSHIHWPIRDSTCDCATGGNWCRSPQSMTSIPLKEWPGHSGSASSFPMPMFLNKMARNVFAIIENSSMIR